MSVGELRDHLQRGHAPLLLDVREPWEFHICAIQGSHNVPMQAIPRVLSGLSPDQEIVVVCHHGIRSRVIADYLERCGFLSVINLAGGVDAWAKEIDPSLNVY